MSMCNHEIKVYLFVNKKKIVLPHPDKSCIFLHLKHVTLTLNHECEREQSDHYTPFRRCIIMVEATALHRIPSLQNVYIIKLDKDTFELLISQQIHLNV